MSELLPCPFCGGEAEFDRKGDTRRSTIVSCNSCGVTVEDGSTFNFESSWNTRTSPEGGEVKVSDKTLLRELMSRNKPQAAPRKITLTEENKIVTIGIGKDHHCSLIIHEDDLKELMK